MLSQSVKTHVSSQTGQLAKSRQWTVKASLKSREKGILTFCFYTNYLIRFSSATLNTNEKSNVLTDDTIFRAEIQPAYLLNGNLRTALSWLDHPKCNTERRDFNVRVQSVRCARQMSTEQLIGGQCIAQLEQLHFSCEYLVEVRDVGDGQVNQI